MRSKDRLNRVRNLGCCVGGCGKQAVAAHSNFYKHGKGRGIKASDEYVIPLCVEHHHQFDTYSMGMNREQSKEWFEAKLHYVDRVLDEQDNQTEFYAL